MAPKMSSILWTLLLLLLLICPSRQQGTGHGCGPPEKVKHTKPIQGQTFPGHTRLRYRCEDGFTRRVGTSTLFKCVERNWINKPNLECIPDPKLKTV
ncbi:interleukin-15 receptor subunit alpha [Engraulis encrasicolus]|uniref:interleukin-15 receptor subunit alpha n=1 Tax=Engraulis encrasicolus TaxID=184585 RepID=UPI002FD0032D